MAKVEVIKAREKFNSKKLPISDKKERLKQMLRLMALSYHTRPKLRRKIKDPSEPKYILVKRMHAAK